MEAYITWELEEELKIKVGIQGEKNKNKENMNFIANNIILYINKSTSYKNKKQIIWAVIKFTRQYSNIYLLFLLWYIPFNRIKKIW